jgi:hypothetical protein
MIGDFLEFTLPRPDNRPLMKKLFVKTYGCQMNAPARHRRAFKEEQ